MGTTIISAHPQISTQVIQKNKYKMKTLLVFAVVAIAVAYGGTRGNSYGGSYGGYKSYNGGYFSGRYSYRGKYPGYCGAPSGLYFKNDRSFVYCSNGLAYTQDCAPGSRNNRYDSYHHGSNYGYADFCSVNLVDYGYAAKHAKGYGGYNRGGYGGYNKGYGGNRGYGGYNRVGYGGYAGGYDGYAKH